MHICTDCPLSRFGPLSRPDKYELYDLVADLSEKNDLAAKLPEVGNRMKAEMEAWQASVRASIKGEDYPEKKVLGEEKAAGK